MSDLHRELSEILLHKIGGNVDHTILTAICEFIDNSLDANADIINISVEKDTESNKKFLIITDNGNGIPNIKNIMLGLEGKINKKGCKNQGFLDTISFFTNINGILDIYTNYNKKYSRVYFDFTKMKDEFLKQKNNNKNINFKECQNKLEEEYTYFPHQHTIEYLETKPNILDKIQVTGTYIKMELFKDFDFKDINLKYFQYNYNQKFKLNFKGDSIDINSEDNICESKYFKHATCKIFRSTHIDGNKIYKISNNFNEDTKYLNYHKSADRYNDIDFKKYNELLKTYEEEKREEEIASLKFSLISNEYAQKQKNTYNDTLENMRLLYISYQNKILGPYKYPNKITGFASPRNLLDIRVLLETKDDSLIKDIIMTNKSKTNLDNLDISLIKFICNCKEYFQLTYKDDIGIKFKSDGYFGIPDMIEFLKNRKKKITEPLNINKTYINWDSAIYFGISNCDKDNGICISNNTIECHFGTTSYDPKLLESSKKLGSNWRIIYYNRINKDGIKKINGRVLIESKIYEVLTNNDFKKIIKWQHNSKKNFTCPKKELNKVIRKIIEISNMYLGSWD